MGRLRPPQAAHKTLASSAASPSSHIPGSLSQYAEKEQGFTPYPERQDVDELIEKATRPEELLELLGGGHCLHQNHAALALIQLSRLLSEKPEDKAPLVQDARFRQLLHLVNSQVGAGAWGRRRCPRLPVCEPCRGRVCPHGERAREASLPQRSTGAPPLGLGRRRHTLEAGGGGGAQTLEEGMGIVQPVSSSKSQRRDEGEHSSEKLP